MNNSALMSFCANPAYGLLSPYWIAQLSHDGQFIEWHGKDCPFDQSLGQFFDELVAGVSWDDLANESFWRGEVIVHEEPYHLSFLRSPTNEMLLAMSPPSTADHSALWAGHLAHELRTPLLVLRERLNLLASSLPGIARPLELCEHLLNIVKSIQALSLGQRDSHHHPINLRHPIDEAINLCSGRIEQQGVAVEVHQTDEQVIVRGNLAQLTQVFLNLITNALDALSDQPSPQLTITVVVEYSIARIEVCDNGPGINPDMLGRLMQPFQTSKPIGKGTGLGLHISRQTMLRHRGNLQVIPVSQGACFEVSLPTSNSYED